ncbi:MAG: hypothetical protein ACXACK_18210 [Candidatus Hodarchaeales archaeon]|jgi:hypothetical protein
MTTVRLSKDDEDLLERLRARYILMGKKMTKKEILGKLIRHEAKKFEDQPVNHHLPELEDDIAWNLLFKPMKWGIKDTSTTVDEHLYQ